MFPSSMSTSKIYVIYLLMLHKSIVNQYLQSLKSSLLYLYCKITFIHNGRQWCFSKNKYSLRKLSADSLSCDMHINQACFSKSLTQKPCKTFYQVTDQSWICYKDGQALIGCFILDLITCKFVKKFPQPKFNISWVLFYEVQQKDLGVHQVDFVPTVIWSVVPLWMTEDMLIDLKWLKIKVRKVELI